MSTHVSTTTLKPIEPFEARVQAVFSSQFQAQVRKTDILFGYLFIVQWLIGIAFALLISPRAWSGAVSQIHLHVYAAIFLGGIVAGLPVYLVFSNPGVTLNRMVVATSQILFSVLLIHLTGGRIETHFHVFGSLAFLAFYRDWRPVLIGTAVTLVDHLVRGAFWPRSVYGVLTAGPWRAFEHVAWVIFEDFILWYSIRLAIGEMKSVSISQVKLEETIASIEEQVLERTRALQESQRTVLEQQQALMSASKMSALGEMAGGIAHEINTPLAAVRTLSAQIEEVLTEEPLNKALVAEMASKVVKTSDRIAKIIRGLTSFSREGGQDAFERIEVQRLIQDTLSFCQERFHSRGVQVVVEGIPQGLSFEGRFAEVSQVLLNLLNNAHDAVSALNEKRITISAKASQDGVEIRVTDSGGGIPAAIQEKLFQPFFTTKEVGKGTGMGLSISLGIIKRHGGQLELDTQSKNTSFILRMPIHQQPIHQQ